MSIHSAYDVPDDRQPNSKAFIKETSKVNSSVNGLRNRRNAPAQKPTHIGQWKK
jgi:hypothetical protein